DPPRLLPLAEEPLPPVLAMRPVLCEVRTALATTAPIAISILPFEVVFRGQYSDQFRTYIAHAESQLARSLPLHHQNIRPHWLQVSAWAGASSRVNRVTAMVSANPCPNMPTGVWNLGRASPLM